MSAGSFDQLAREAIYEAAGWRCVGCGVADPLTCQHRRARGMGGTSRRGIGHPANGVALCGSGTTGCHGWTEAHPTLARWLGWRLEAGEDPVGAPFWTRHGWRAWDEELLVRWVWDDELVMPDARAAAVEAFRRFALVVA